MNTDISFLVATTFGTPYGNFAARFCSMLTSSWLQAVFIIIPCSIFIISRRYNLLVSFLSVPAFVSLLRHTTEGISVPDCYADKLPLFVGGFLIIAGINIYCHLLKN